MGSTFAKIVAFLEVATFSDVLVPGFIDAVSGVGRFQPLFDSIYITAGENHLRASAINQGDQLDLRIVTEIEHGKAVMDDPKVDVAVGCLSELFFGEGQSLYCVSARFLLDGKSRIDDGVVKCAEFEFSYGQRIYLDPCWSFGVRPGTVDTERYRKGVTGPYGYLDEYKWSRADGK